ncbi:MAG: sulfatase [Myxococcota bacterium]
MITWLLACSPAPVDRRPDVIVVSVDTLRADRLGFMGHAQARTPAMDGLAAGGRVFEQATTPLPRTTPALGSLQTGLRPVHHGAREVGEVVTAEGRLAGWLGEAGWQTRAVSAIQVAGPDQALDRGFDGFEVHHDARAREVSRAALHLVEGLDPGAPAYLWVHYADPHFPYLPEGGDPTDEACRKLGERAAAGKLDRVSLFADRGGVATAVVESCRRLYDGEIAAVDAGIAALFRGLDAARGDRPRLVVLTADHGENQGENGLFFEHGPDLSDASVRVPLVISGPGVTPGRDGGVARLEDVAPTLLTLTGLPVPAGLDGASLLGPRAPHAPIESGSPLQVGLHRYLVSGKRDRWCLNEGPLSWCTLGKRAPGLFDHDADPKLQTELSSDRPADADRLRAAAERWAPGSTHVRGVRTPALELRSVPTIDGWVEQVVAITSPPPWVDPPADPALAAPLRPALLDLSAAIDAAESGGQGATEAALRELGYVE